MDQAQDKQQDPMLEVKQKYYHLCAQLGEKNYQIKALQSECAILEVELSKLAQSLKGEQQNG